MLQLLRSSFGLWLIWAALLLTFLVVRPTLYSATFWVLLVAVGFATIAPMGNSHRENKKEQGAYAAWSNRLTSLSATIDVEDDGHLFEWLDPPHWQQVFVALEGMPVGSRSLRQAILVTFPDTLK